MQGNDQWRTYAWQRFVLDRTGPVQLPIITADGQLIDIEHGKYFATGGYLQYGPRLEEWFRSFRSTGRDTADDLSACSNYNELISIEDGAFREESIGLNSYWLRSDSQMGISYLRRAFCRFLRTNDIDVAVRPFKVKFKAPVQRVLGLYVKSKSFPRLVKIPGLENMLADYLARNAPWAFGGMFTECKWYPSFLPSYKARYDRRSICLQ
ncbi:hypothetical protein FRX31_021666 [Thalictrum thalictroides]|uniref:Uncharacterized protein n=1 Tax=Thalictrum thalictroides TaxID=46969 RepID=A0A7J6VUG6_THATH|nr:hypothetical protein FRX31_021666 [Thalictrum thalictroides]